MSKEQRDKDVQFMMRALELARAGVGLASPNPCVGAVVVAESGEVVGEGTHTYEGWKHAEVLALEQAGERARGATLYLTLEPCSHEGRTGPCADAVVAAGIRRVVAAMQDPNPAVSGKGFEKLRAAGVEIGTGVLEEQARKLNEAFAKWIRTGLPLVTVKSAMTLDGKIAAPDRDSRRYITGEVARAHVMEMRHATDAILVGAGTVLADDPMLTDRSGKRRRRPLMRVILDSTLRIPVDSRLVQSANGDVVVFCTRAEEKRQNALLDRGVQVEQVEGGTRIEFASVIKRLGEMQLLSVMVEGGAAVCWAALESNQVDKVFLYYAPRILAGNAAVPFATGSGYRTIEESAHLSDVVLHRFGEDFAVEGYLRNPYE